MSKEPRINLCIVCGKSYEARKRRYKLTCSTTCGIANMKRWMEKSMKLSRQLHKEDRDKVGC